MAKSASTFEVTSLTNGQTVATVYSEQEAQKRVQGNSDLTYSPVWHSPSCYCDSFHHLHAY